jgi:hypothetical protein
MASIHHNVQLDATRSTDEPPKMWVMQVRYSPHFSPTEVADQTPPSGVKHHYKVKALLKDQRIASFAGSPGASTGTSGHPHLTIADNDTPQTLTFKISGDDMRTEGIKDGAPKDRADVIAQVQIFDLDVSPSNPEDTQKSPGLDLYTDLPPHP